MVQRSVRGYFIEAIPNRERPDTSWVDSCLEENVYVQSEGREEYSNPKPSDIPHEDYRLLLWLPFMDSDLDTAKKIGRGIMDSLNKVIVKTFR
jgi:hypothetical protein